MYALTDRNNIILDLIQEVRYTKLQSLPCIVIACKEDEATGVIASDNNTIYPLIKNDNSHQSNAVNIVEVNSAPSNFISGCFKYNLETETIDYLYSLDEAKRLKQLENKTAFAIFLDSQSILWTDGKYYGVSEADQSEISLNINQYMMALNAGIENPTLEWHAQREECRPWIYEDLIALTLQISNFVYPYYHQMQEQKTAIYACETLEELEAIAFHFSAE